MNAPAGGDLAAARGVVQDEQGALPGHPVPPQGSPAFQVPGKEAGVYPGSCQQPAQRRLWQYRVPSGRVTVQVNELRLANGVRTLSFHGKQVQLPDSKGLGDLAALIAACGADVHVLTLVGHKLPRLGADPVLDDQAKAAFKSRLDGLAREIDDANTAGHPELAETLRSEHDALIRELAAATGLGGRDRRLGDEMERARKTVSARVRDALSKIERVHPELATHLRAALRMGTVCSYTPAEPTTWKVS